MSFLFRHSHIRLCNISSLTFFSCVLISLRPPHTLHSPALTYPIEQLPTTAILQEDVVDGPLTPVPIEAHYVGVREHLVHTHLFLHVVHTVLGSGHVHNFHCHRLLRLPVDQQTYSERQRSKVKMWILIM